jgi:hypothetical protein
MKTNLGCKWKVTVRDLDGNIVDEQSGQNSFLIAYAKLLQASFSAEMVSFTCIDGVSRYLGWVTDGTGSIGDVKYSGFDIGASNGEDDIGIVVGTGTSVVTNTDYALETLISHGSSSGEMYYDDGYIYAVNIGASNAMQQVNRSIINNSGSDIIASEIGIYAKMYDETATQYSICIIRDIIPSVVCANGYVITIEYQIFVEV